MELQTVNNYRGNWY